MIDDNGVTINTEIATATEINTKIESGGEIKVSLDKIVAWNMIYGKPGFLESFDSDLYSFYYVQSTPSSIWTVTHGLGKEGISVTVIDSSGRVVVGDVRVLDSNSVMLEFSSPFSGKAYFV